jgi:hypothetical protein
MSDINKPVAWAVLNNPLYRHPTLTATSAVADRTIP